MDAVLGIKTIQEPHSNLEENGNKIEAENQMIPPQPILKVIIHCTCDFFHCTMIVINEGEDNFDKRS